jgi:hypothetical protein
MYRKKFSMLVVLAVALGSVFVTPAIAKEKGNKTSFTGTEIFASYIDRGKRTTTADGGTTLRRQTVVNFKYSTDERMIGINTITFDAVFDASGSGPAEGKFRIQAGTFEGQGSMTAPPMVYSEVNPCKTASRKHPKQQCYQYEPEYYGPNLWLVFYPNGGEWVGRFSSTLASYGANPLSSSARGTGSGKYGGQKFTATSNGYVYSGTIQ